VEGVYTCDPRTEPRARKLKDVSHEELIELAAAGAAVMQARSVEVARRRAVPFEVLSSFSESPGTVVHSTPPGGAVEKAVVTSIALSPGQAEVLMAGLADPVGATAAVFAALSRAGIKTDLPVQWEDGDGRRQISVLVPAADRRRIMDMIRPVKKAIGISHLSSENGLATVSIIGTGVRSDPSVIAKVFEALKKEGTAIRRFVASEIRLSCVVSEDRARRAASALHAAFGLGGERGA